MKKITTTLLSLLLTISMMPVGSFAAEESLSQITDELVSEQAETSEDSFEFDKGTKTIKKYKGTDKDVVIPEKIDGVAVEKIGRQAFSKSQIDSVTFNKELKEIGDGAFGLSTVKTVALNEGLEKIGDGAFSNCSNLENINFPNSLVSIGKYAFLNCTKISREIVLRENLEKVLTSAFKGCNNMKITIANKGIPIAIYENNLYDINLPISLPNTRDVFLSSGAFKGSNQDNYSVDLGTIDVKESINKEELKKELEKIPFKIGSTTNDFSTLPYTLVWELDDFNLSKSNTISGHFEGCDTCGLDKIKINIKLNPISTNKETDASNFIFNKDTKTITKYNGTDKDVVIPEKIDGVTVEKIGKQAFSKSKIDSVTFNKELEEVDSFAFVASTVKTIVANEGLKKIGFNSFTNCKSLTEFNFPDSLLSIDRDAFKNCSNLEGTLNIGEKFELLGSSALKYSPKVKLNISKADAPVKIMEENINSVNSPLHVPTSREVFITKTSFLIENSVVDLGILKVDKNISKKDLEEKLKKIPFSYGTTTYKDGNTIVDSKEKPQWNLDRFDINESNELETNINPSDPNSTTVKIKIAAKSDTESSVWASEDFTYGDIPSTILDSPTYFAITGLSKKGHEKIKTEKHLVIPYEVKIKENDKTVIKKIRGIGKESFNNLGIEKLTLPEMKDGYSKFIIDSSAFADNKLTELHIPDGVFAIDTFAFANNDITKLYIPASVLKIGSEAFKNNKISELEISDDVSKIQIDNYSFMNNKLEEVHIPYSVFKIKHYVFKDNPGKDGKGQVYLYTRNPKHLTSDTYMYSSEYQKFILVSSNINREPLFSTIRSVLNLIPEEYKEESWNEMNKVLNKAKKVFKNEASNQKEIDNANKKLNDAIKNLSPANVIKTSLENEIKDIRDYNEKLYTAESWSKFKTALAEAQKIFENDDAEQTDADNALSELKNSIKSLEIKEEMKWTKDDFTYEGSKITGYSKLGAEKYKVNKFLIIPDTTPDGKPVTAIGKKAFMTTEGVVYRTDDVSSPLGLKTVKIPDKVEVIEDSAFRQNNLSHVDLPSSLTTIGDSAFNANQLKDLKIPDSVTKMGSGCFSLNLIENIKFSRGMDEIPDGILSRNIYLKNIEIPDTVKRIGKSAFVGAPLTELHIPSSVETIEYKAFSGQRCKEIKIPGSVKKIGKLAFEENVKFRHTKKLILEEGIEEIEYGAFKSCLLEAVKLPNSLIKLDEAAFKDNMDTEKNIVTVKLISRNPEHAKLFESNEMQKIFIETPSHSSSGNSNSVNSKDKTISRVEGKTRIHTATEISKKYFKNADKVILVSSTQLADSLISPVHAKRLDSPILLSGKDFLDKSVLDELKRLNTSSVDIVGGENSIGENVVKELENNGIKVNRIAGEDRYKTSIKLAEQMYKDSKYDEVFVVDGTNIADGLSVANFSTKVNAPVILTSPEKIDKSAIDFMNAKSIKKVHIIGGTNSVSRNVENSLNKFKTNRIAGENRYETSRMIANLAYPNAKSIHIANGVTGIDALVSGAIIPKTNMPLILVNENDISTSKLLQNSSIKNINIIGGNDSISKNFINSVIK
ncbi:leucine-rich repeat protein [Peptostreptococcus russellii]|uniref:leucine-rich repeat protein n=1 Tax=Peptostreptococcus russellii TaxID=215200 RepID=UPI0026E99E7F|nr:leucine-rich repeat protein [Peptostreptococcus russellii]